MIIGFWEERSEAQAEVVVRLDAKCDRAREQVFTSAAQV